MGFLTDVFKSVIFTIYILFILGLAIVVFYYLNGRDMAAWVSWAGAIGVIVILGGAYVLWPGGQKTDRTDDKR